MYWVSVSQCWHWQLQGGFCEEKSLTGEASVRKGGPMPDTAASIQFQPLPTTPSEAQLLVAPVRKHI